MSVELVNHSIYLRFGRAELSFALLRDRKVPLSIYSGINYIFQSELAVKRGVSCIFYSGKGCLGVAVA